MVYNYARNMGTENWPDCWQLFEVYTPMAVAWVLRLPGLLSREAHTGPHESCIAYLQGVDFATGCKKGHKKGTCDLKIEVKGPSILFSSCWHIPEGPLPETKVPTESRPPSEDACCKEAYNKDVPHLAAGIFGPHPALYLGNHPEKRPT